MFLHAGAAPAPAGRLQPPPQILPSPSRAQPSTPVLIPLATQDLPPCTRWEAAPKPRPLSDHSISARLFKSPSHAQDLPLDKLGGFGGKLGEALRGLGCATAGQVCTRVLETLTVADIV